MRTGARPAGKSPARGRARARSKGKKKSPPRGGPRQFRPELAGERACASAHRRPSPRLPSVGGLARCSAIPASPEARALGVSISRALCGEGGRGSTEGREEADRAWKKGKTALAERGARSTGWSLQKTRLYPSRPSGLRKYSGDSRGTEATGGLQFPEGSAAPRLQLPAAPGHQAFFSLLPPRAKLQFPGGVARSGLEVGSLEVTRATGAGGVSSKRRGSGYRGRGARCAGSWDAQVCGSGCRVGLAQGWWGIGVPSDPEGQRGRATGRTAGCGDRLLGAAAAGL